MKLVIEDLKKNFGSKEVLKGATFTFEPGKIYALLGRNGAGKTTFFNCLNEDLDIDGGKYYIEEDKKNRKILPEEIGYVLSTPTVPEFLTGREFLRFFLDINKNRIEGLKDIDYYFDLIGIKEEDRGKLLKEYSHGMKSKMQMIVNIICNTKILLLDEPLTSLDVVAAEEFKKMLIKIKKEKILIFSTHIMELATSLCDEIVLLNHGVFEKIDKKDLDKKALTTKIIDALKEE